MLFILHFHQQALANKCSLFQNQVGGLERWKKCNPRNTLQFLLSFRLSKILPSFHCIITLLQSNYQLLYPALIPDLNDSSTIRENLKACEISVCQLFSEFRKTVSVNSSIEFQQEENSGIAIFNISVNWQYSRSPSFNSPNFESIEKLGKVMSQFMFNG